MVAVMLAPWLTELELRVPSGSVVVGISKLKMGGTVAVTRIWSLPTVAVAKSEESIALPPLVCVATVPILSEPVLEGVCSAAGVALYQLKQYVVLLEARSVLGNVTTWPVTLVAVPMPGQAATVPLVGQPSCMVVSTVQLEAAARVKPVGKVTNTFPSVDPMLVVDGLAHTVPLV